MRRIVVASWVLLLSHSFVFAQASGTGTVTGRVADSSGGVLPGVTVTMKSPQALGQFTAVTDAQGLYRISNLAPAPYEARSELQGFQTVDAFNVFNSDAAFGFLSADVRSSNFGVKTNFVQLSVGQVGARFVF